MHVIVGQGNSHIKIYIYVISGLGTIGKMTKDIDSLVVCHISLLNESKSKFCFPGLAQLLFGRAPI